MFVRVSEKGVIVVCGNNVLVNHDGRLAKIKVTKREDLDRLARMYGETGTVIDTVLAGLQEEGVEIPE